MQFIITQREKEELRKRTIELEKQINAKQGLELEIERMRGSLSVMKHMENDEDSKFKQKIDDTQKALQEKEEELEYVEAINQALVVQGLKTNDELQEARKELINVSNLFHYMSMHIYQIISSILDSGI